MKLNRTIKSELTALNGIVIGNIMNQSFGTGARLYLTNRSLHWMDKDDIVNILKEFEIYEKITSALPLE